MVCMSVKNNNKKSLLVLTISYTSSSTLVIKTVDAYFLHNNFTTRNLYNHLLVRSTNTF